MGGLFGTEIPETKEIQASDHDRTISDHDRTMLQLKTQRNKLNIYKKKIHILVNQETIAAKKFALEGNREKAVYCLRRKKYQEVLLDKAEINLSNLEELISTLEWTHIQRQVFESIKLGTENLKAINDQITLADVEDVLADTQEAMDQQKEIQQLFTNTLTDEDEADVLAELEALEAGNDLVLPEVPRTPISSENTVKNTTNSKPNQKHREKVTS